MEEKVPKRKRLSLLKKPQPKILIPSPMPIPRLEITLVSHLHRLRIGKRHTQPSIVGRSLYLRAPLHLDFEQSPRPKQAIHLAHIALNHLAARDVLEHNRRIRE